MSEVPTIRVRTAAPSEGPGLARMDAIGWPLEVQVVPPAAADEPFFTRHRAPEDIVVAREGRVLLGYAQLAPHIPIEKNAHVLHLNALVVAPEARGRGISHLLIDAAIAEARRRGARKLGLRALSTTVGLVIAVTLLSTFSVGFATYAAMLQRQAIGDPVYYRDIQTQFDQLAVMFAGLVGAAGIIAAAGVIGPWPLIVDTVSVRLCRFRERSGACGFVGVRADVADRGVAPASVVAVRPPEHGPVGGGLVRERWPAGEEFALERGVEAFRE
jgi:GNAT superfamily N-acetyltransferase